MLFRKKIKFYYHFDNNISKSPVLLLACNCKFVYYLDLVT